MKKHTHEEREHIIKRMIPMIKKKFGKNLVALAASASFARNEDGAYSDLELNAFVRKMPAGTRIGAIGRICDGMMIELLWMTRETYLEEMDVTRDWYVAGSDHLKPIINRRFINALNRHKIQNLQHKCMKRAADCWYQVHEATAKVLNAIEKRNRTGIPLLLFDMVLNMLKTLSFLNQEPYKTFSEFIAQSRHFKVRPHHFDKLGQIVVDGNYQDLSAIKNTTTIVFAEFEKIFARSKFKLYDDNFDPGIPGKPWYNEKK